MSDDLTDDEALWRAACAGDGEAFGQLFDRHHARVRRHAARLVPDPADVEDVAATAFLELWRLRDRVRLVRGCVLPWLLVTTTNVARNASRSTRRYRAFLARLPRPAAEPDAAQSVLDRTLDRPWSDALATLSARDRRLVALVVLDGLPLADAAAVLGLTPSAAKSRLHRARAHLRDAWVPDPTPDLQEAPR
ncbi:RNA polymerase sigma factor [Cellulomonas gilvus]|uniref:RNA polymerase sigma factor n=1 Tax=Cellulomonas gilvus TaxID=11 RepID=UPI000307495F|nr:sigma-70 family RNA polymerase sigma factor [Cellulomonas gilvus]